MKFKEDNYYLLNTTDAGWYYNNLKDRFPIVVKYIKENKGFGTSNSGVFVFEINNLSQETTSDRITDGTDTFKDVTPVYNKMRSLIKMKISHKEAELLNEIINAFKNGSYPSKIDFKYMNSLWSNYK